MPDRSITIDLNADVGEGCGPGPSGDDAPLLAQVTSAHIACGGHAGDEMTMRRSVFAAKAAGTAVGAHPSYADRAGFGRRELDIAASVVAQQVRAQVSALAAIASDCGSRLRSVKPHGALYARIGRDDECARAVAEVVADLDPGIRLVLPAGSASLSVAVEVGVPVLAEAFSDRGYLPDGTLAPRGEVGALITDRDEAARRAVSIALNHVVRAVDGTMLNMEAATICVHGDTPGALAIAQTVRRALADAGVEVAAPGLLA